jgi:uncharacterized protein (DUF1697 family)
MKRYIAFLRAINVGGRFVKMDRLRQQFVLLGLSDVQTYIQSGNVIFETADTNIAELERMVEEQLQTELGYQVPTLIRTERELMHVANYKPFPESKLMDGSALYISFLKEVPGQGLQRQLTDLSSTIDQFHIHERQVYWLMHKHLGKSTFTNAKLEKVLKVSATRRNSSTVQKIVAKFFA